MTCTSARSVILDLLRGATTEADRLRLEQHLAGCADCRRERARWGLVERARDLPVRSLSASARGRVLRRLVAEAAAPAPPQILVAPRPAVRPMTVAAVAMAAAAMLLLAVRVAPSLRRAGEAETAQAVVVPSGQLVGGEGAGSVRIAGAQVLYAARSSVRLTDARRVDLLDGEVEVEVTPGGPGRFRVYAPRFIVEVLGTRFVVRKDGVRTLHGTVRVLDRDERELRVVRAGESWTAPPVVAAAPPSTAPAAVAATAVQVVSPAPPPSRARSAAALLADAARALAEGRTAEARRSVRAALAAAPLPREHARADLALADAERIDRQPARALAGYRLVAERWSHLPEGEQALFLIAQIQAERGDAGAARAAFSEYLSRYPSGRFHELAESRLAVLRPAP